MNSYFAVLFILNAIWFGTGFWSFSVRHEKTVRLIIGEHDSKGELFRVVAYSLKFLGGLNLAFAIFALVVAIQPAIFPSPLQHTLLSLIFGFAHGTQFYFNIPVAIKEYRGEPHLWSVLKGKMFFIFLTDACLCILNFVFAFYSYTVR
jgi:hypothetical protein